MLHLLETQCQGTVVVQNMGFWSFKKDSKKRRRREILKKSGQTWLPKYAELMGEDRRLSRKDRKRYNDISEEVGLFMKLGAPSYYEHLDLTTIIRDSPEHDRLKDSIGRSRELVEEYLAKHPEVPDNMRSLILRFNSLSETMLESIIVDQEQIA